MVFQLTDDVLDLIATDDFLGKPAGSDIGEGTFTLPVLHALNGPTGSEIRMLLAGGKPHEPEVVERVVHLVREGGHVDTALAEVDRRMGDAAAAVAALSTSEVTGVFRALGDYLIERVTRAGG
jgi:geranylgeranyl pyrophosphate synthase